MTSSDQIITREEYDALMSELAQEAMPKSLTSFPDTAEKLRKLEFDMMILVGLIVAVFMFMVK